MGEEGEWGAREKWLLGLEEGVTAAGQESQRLLGPGGFVRGILQVKMNCLQVPERGEQWGVNGNYSFPFLSGLNGNPANKNPRERRRPFELQLNLAGGQTLPLSCSRE